MASCCVSRVSARFPRRCPPVSLQSRSLRTAPVLTKIVVRLVAPWGINAAIFREVGATGELRTISFSWASRPSGLRNPGAFPGTLLSRRDNSVVESAVWAFRVTGHRTLPYLAWRTTKTRLLQRSPATVILRE